MAPKFYYEIGETDMQLDRNMLEKLLSLNDSQLSAVIRSLAQSSGLDLSSFNISPNDISSIRSALSGATDEDIKRAQDQLQSRKNERK